MEAPEDRTEEREGDETGRDDDGADDDVAEGERSSWFSLLVYGTRHTPLGVAKAGLLSWT